MVDVLSLALVFAAGLIGSSFGTLVGGTSLLTIPTLIFLGLPASVAIGTNRAGLIGLVAAGIYAFEKKGFVNHKVGWVLGLAAILGAIIGANLVFQLNEAVLKKVIAVLTLIMLIVIIIEEEAGLKSKKKTITIRQYAIGAVIGFFLGIYGGFYGANLGTFMSYLLIILFGQSFIQSAATRKIAVGTIAVAATIIFAFNDAIIYSLALALFAGSFIGSYLGAIHADKIGNKWIKRAFIAVIVFMSMTLFF